MTPLSTGLEDAAGDHEADSGCLAAEQQLTIALASFQSQVEPIASPDLAAVVRAGRPVFSSGCRWSAQLLHHQGQRHLRVSLVHAGGAELCSEALADDLEDPLATAGRMLALLLGIPVSALARTAEPESRDSGPNEAEEGAEGAAAADPSAPKAEPVPAPAAPTPRAAAQDSAAQDTPASAPASPGDSPAAERSRPSDPALLPLEAEAIKDCHQRILALPAAVRRQLTTAFREHFAVPRSARSIGDRITQHRHLAFIELFLQECGSSSAEPQAAAAEEAG